MSDQHPDDDLIRASLQADAEDIHAGEHLLEQIRARVTRPSRIRPTGLWLLASAAALAVIALVAATLQESETTVDTAGDPPTSSPAPAHDAVVDQLIGTCGIGADADLYVYFDLEATRGEIKAVEVKLQEDPLVDRYDFIDQQAAYAEAQERLSREVLEALTPDIMLASFLVTFRGDPPVSVRGALAAELKGADGVFEVVLSDCEDSEAPNTPGTPERPALVALVREDGWLVTVDLGTGEETELHSVGDPRAERVEGGPYFIDDVDLSPDGQWIYFSTCCEPAVGVTYRIPTTGGEPEQVGYGAFLRVSPDGRFVATAGSDLMYVHRVDGIGTLAQPVSVEVGCCATSLTWSPDGSQLAYVVGTGAEGDVPQAHLLDWDGTTLTEAPMGKPDNPGSFVSWTPGGMLNIISGGPVADDRYLSQDISYEWLLWVDEEGVVREQAGNEASERTPIEGLPEALAADW